MIRAQGLAKSFRGVRVLDGLDLAIGRGERVALVGANGAGKTTLIRCLLGEYVHEGVLEVDGATPRRDRARVLRRVGFVPQIPPPLHMSVGSLLEFAARVCGASVTRMESVAEALGLDARGISHQSFTRLSGGQKQKLLIAVALGRSCDLLVLDEPAASLDPRARRTFFDLLGDLGDGTTILLSSHRIDEVTSLVGRVVELDHGRIVLDDRVLGPGRIDARLRCRVVLSQPVEAAVHAMTGFGLTPDESGLVFEGVLAGADRLRFLGVAARYSGVLASLLVEEESRRGVAA